MRLTKIQQLAEKIKHYAPAHFKDICEALNIICDEIDNTMSFLSSESNKAQNQYNFEKAKEIINTQNDLHKIMSNIQNLLDIFNDKNEKDNQDNTIIIPTKLPDNYELSQNNGEITAIKERKEQVDYSIYDTDNTIAYDIKDTPVTYKRPDAFSYNGRRYTVSTWKDMLLQLCGILYKEDSRIIKEMIGEKRQWGKTKIPVYYDKPSKGDPRKIPGSNIWIVTNRSAENLRDIMITLLDKYSIYYDDVKVYFKRDLTKRHPSKDKNIE